MNNFVTDVKRWIYAGVILIISRGRITKQKWENLRKLCQWEERLKEKRTEFQSRNCEGLGGFQLLKK